MSKSLSQEEQITLLKASLLTAMGILSRNEPEDSRAVSDLFVAFACVQSDLADESCEKIIYDALNEEIEFSAKMHKALMQINSDLLEENVSFKDSVEKVIKDTIPVEYAKERGMHLDIIIETEDMLK